MKQNRKNYETNNDQDDINGDPELGDPFADASGYDPANMPLIRDDHIWDFDNPEMDEELVREIQEQESRDYIDFLSDDLDIDQDERAA